ncbi:MAG: tetratricopeptide repeat protein [Acidobacteria bacterium]|nr:tetratricopeptide repeat protein [Acidobacteriota bacterium]
MKAETWRRVEAVLLPAMDLEGESRRDFIRSRCSADETLVQQVETFLAILEGSGGASPEDSPRSPSPPVSATGDNEGSIPDPLATGSLVGPYRIEGLLGSGGMGSVYLAERADGTFAKRVALKFLRPGRRSPEARARFHLERRLLARLEHPHIARLHDAGETDDHHSFFVMEYVDGEAIDVYCDRQQLDLPARIRLFLGVCEGVQFAHRNLVVHRDLKPANILVDKTGAPKLLDFGIAKLLEPNGAENGLSATASHLRPLTPLYASPEQVEGEAITTATDVYALGLLLFRLFTGAVPFAELAAEPARLARAIAETDPAPPSRVVARDPTGNGLPTMSPKRLARSLAGDLDAIVLKALRKEPTRRYPSVEQLALDLGRYLEALPVEARRGTTLYRTAKFLRRHALATTAAAAIFLLTSGFSFAMAAQARRTALQRDRARAVESFLVDSFSLANPLEAGGDVSAREVLDRGTRRIGSALLGQPESQASLLRAMGEAYLGLGALKDARALLERALELLEGQEDSDPETRARIFLLLGRTALAQNELDQAEAWAEKAQRMDVDGGDDGIRFAVHVQQLQAGIARQRAEFDRAEVLLLEVIARLRRSQPEGDPDLSRTLEDLAGIYTEVGRHGEATKLLEEVRELHSRYRGATSLEVGLVTAELANLALYRGEDLEAKRLALEALASLEPLLGGEQPEVRSLKGALATALTNLGEKEAAEAIYRQILEEAVPVLGPQHPTVAVYQHNLANLLSGTGRFEAAETLMRQALETMIVQYGESHPRAAFAMTTYASILRESGRLEEARHHAERSLALLRQMDPPTTPAFTLEELGRVALETEDPALAEKYFREALSYWRSQPQPPRRRVAQVGGRLGVSLLLQDQFQEAEALLLAQAEAYRSLFPPGHISRILNRRHLVSLYRRWKKPEEELEQEAQLEEEQAAATQ